MRSPTASWPVVAVTRPRVPPPPRRSRWPSGSASSSPVRARPPPRSSPPRPPRRPTRPPMPPPPRPPPRCRSRRLRPSPRPRPRPRPRTRPRRPRSPLRRPRPRTPPRPDHPSPTTVTLCRRSTGPPMANYTAADIKALRERTGAGMLDVKKALDEAEGDQSKATEILRIKGLKGVTKREGRTTSNGLVVAQAEGGVGTLVEVLCETDFVAKSEPFRVLADQVLAAAVAAGATDADSLL